MRCLEIWLNGQRVKLIGHPDALMLAAEVAVWAKYSSPGKAEFLQAHAIVWKEGTQAKDHLWDMPDISVGDEVLIRLVESEAPEPPTYDMVDYGIRLPPPLGDPSGCCSFCGAQASHRKKMFNGPKVRICDACVNFYRRFTDHEDPSST